MLERAEHLVDMVQRYGGRRATAEIIPINVRRGKSDA